MFSENYVHWIKHPMMAQQWHLNTKVFFYMKDTLPMSLSGQSVTDVTDDVNTKIEQCHKSMCTAHHS